MAHTWWAVSTPRECRCCKPDGERLWESRCVETQRQGSHCAWESRKRRGIPTFPQPRRRLFNLNWKADTSRATKSGHLHVLTTAQSADFVQEVGEGVPNSVGGE